MGEGHALGPPGCPTGVQEQSDVGGEGRQVLAQRLRTIYPSGRAPKHRSDFNLEGGLQLRMPGQAGQSVTNHGSCVAAHVFSDSSRQPDRDPRRVLRDSKACGAPEPDPPNGYPEGCGSRKSIPPCRSGAQTEDT